MNDAISLEEYTVERIVGVPELAWVESLEEDDAEAFASFLATVPPEIPEHAVPFWSSLPTRTEAEDGEAVVNAFFGGPNGGRYMAWCLAATGVVPCHDDAEAYTIEFGPREGVALPVQLASSTSDFVALVFAHAGDSRRPFPATVVRVFSEDPPVLWDGADPSEETGLLDDCEPGTPVVPVRSEISDTSYFVRLFDPGEDLGVRIRTCERSTHRVASFMVGVDRPVAAHLGEFEQTEGSDFRGVHLARSQPGEFSVVSILRTHDRNSALVSQGIRIGES